MKKICVCIAMICLSGCGNIRLNKVYDGEGGPPEKVNLILMSTKYYSDQVVSELALVNKSGKTIYVPDTLTVHDSGKILLGFNVEGFHGKKAFGGWRINNIVTLRHNESYSYTLEIKADKTVVASEICLGYGDSKADFDVKFNKNVHYTNFVLVPRWSNYSDRQPENP